MFYSIEGGIKVENIIKKKMMWVTDGLSVLAGTEPGL
jgi:hypothetical protein